MTLDVAWLVELTLEHCRLFDVPAFGFCMDTEKCFDRFSMEVLYEREVAAGYLNKLCGADKRYNKISNQPSDLGHH